jgi:CheY-like chemotaxis protein
MDHMMPEMDGVEATKHIRELGSEDSYYINLPIIALTANAVSSAREMFLVNGFDDFLSKPIDIVELNSILEKWISKEKQKPASEDITEGNSDIDMEIEGININKGISLVNGVFKNYLRILSMFHKEGTRKIKEVKESLEAGNYPLYTTYVHAIKSTAANVGADSLSETAKALEAAGKQGDFEFIKLNNDNFLKDLENILNNVSKALSANSEEQKKSIDFETLKPELLKLKKALSVLDGGTINKTANYLQELTQASDISTDIENILQNILMSEYEEAVSVIDRLLSEP